MSLIQIAHPRKTQLTARLRDLTALQRKIEVEVDVIRAELDAIAETERTQRARDSQARRRANPALADIVGLRSGACGTEAGYHWHRTNGPWPLPVADACGCRAAHALHAHPEAHVGNDRLLALVQETYRA